MTENGREQLIQVPGSKSIANRALICASLANSSSTITNCAPGDDTQAMLEALKNLGVETDRDGTTVRIHSQINLENTQPLELQTRLAGTTSRFLTALCALRVGQTTIDGYAPLRKRPMTGLHDALSSLGASVKCLNIAGHLPVIVQRGSSWQARIAIDSTTSSQFTSALMMIAPYFPNGLEIELRGEVISRGYLDMTVAVMRAFGAQTEIAENVIWVSPGVYRGGDFAVEPDASSASYPSAVAAVTGRQVTIVGLSRNSLQRDVEFLDVLSQMGCDVRQRPEGISISRDVARPLRGVTVDMSQISDCVPTLAVVALFADTPTTVSGVGFIRAKESDRIGDLASELRKLGAQIDEHNDGFTVTPVALHGASLATHDDHRLAMAFAIAKLRIGGVEVQNPEVVSKSWPDYFNIFDNFLKN
jgi:3-phosphoshikimate 1-carboxyvinyltransferase